MAGKTLTDRLDAKLAQLDQEIARVTQNQQGEVARIQQVKATLMRAKAQLNPEREALIEELKALGVL